MWPSPFSSSGTGIMSGADPEGLFEEYRATGVTTSLQACALHRMRPTGLVR